VALITERKTLLEDEEIKRLQESANRNFGWSIAGSLGTIVLGILAFAFAPWTGVAAGLAFAILYFLNGVFQAINAYQTRREGRVLPKAAFSILSLAIGLFLFLRPVVTTTILALAMIALVIGGGIMDLWLASKLRPLSHWRWVLANGLAMLFLGGLALARWPLNSPWLVGGIGGAALIVTGFTRLMAVMTLRSLAKRTLLS